MAISSIAFAYRKVVFILLGLALFYGGLSYFQLPAREDPTIVIREAIVTTQFPGLEPERVEQLITKTLEEQIRQIAEVEEIRSTSSTGVSIIHVEVKDRYFELEQIWDDLRNKVERARSELPAGTSAPQINDEIGDVAVITLALTADGFDMGRMFDIAKHVRDVLYGVDGAKKIEILGAQEERIFLETTNARLAQLGVSPGDLVALLQSQNIINPGGAVDVGAMALIVEPSGNFESVEDIGRTLISIPNSNRVLPVQDVFTIRRDFVDPPHQPSYFNGRQAIVFAISALESHNVLEFAPRMRARIQEIENTLPIGYSLDIATYQAEQVQTTVRGVTLSVLQTLAIVLVVVVLFLGLRTGLVVGSIVPFVMLASLAVMNVAGMDLQRMSLATLIISLGLLVDNGIVMAEDFKRRLEEGASREQAMAQGGRELALPLFTSSLTTILVFMPLMMAEHVAGEYTRSISLLILITLTVSWIMALCVTPVLCYYFVRPGAERGAYATAGVGARYEAFLRGVLNWRGPFLVLMFAMLFGAGWLMNFVPKQFFPDSDRAQLLVYVQARAGASPRIMDQHMRRISAMLDDRERFANIQSYAGYVGYGGPRFVLSLSPGDPADNTAFMVVNIDDPERIEASAADLRRAFIEQFPSLFVRVKKMFLGPSDSGLLQVQVKGPDADLIFAKAQEIEQALRSTPGIRDVRTDWENRIAKIVVEVDQRRARRAGVTSEDIATTLQSYFSGRVVTEFREGDDIIPVVLRAEADERYNLDRVRTINVFSSGRGVNVPLFQIADFRPENQFSNIHRENMFRTVTVEGVHPRLAAEDLRALVDPRIQEIAAGLPVNHSIEYDGVIIESQNAQQALSANVPVVIGIIVILLVAQFNSYRRAAIIVLTIPLAFIGAVLGLLAFQAPFGFVATLGLYSLAGIIINNAIVLIDRIDIERKTAASLRDAITRACAVRLRPIAMTTITTILGLTPLLISRDPLFYGMAAAMAFGLGVGTILTLGVTPVLYSLFFRAETR